MDSLHTATADGLEHLKDDSHCTLSQTIVALHSRRRQQRHTPEDHRVMPHSRRLQSRHTPKENSQFRSTFSLNKLYLTVQKHWQEVVPCQNIWERFLRRLGNEQFHSGTNIQGSQNRCIYILYVFWLCTNLFTNTCMANFGSFTMRPPMC